MIAKAWDEENKNTSGLETPEYRRKTPAPEPKPATRTTEHITIPIVEYVYLQRVDALMDVLLNDDSYASSQAVLAVRQSVQDLRRAMQITEAVVEE